MQKRSSSDPIVKILQVPLEPERAFSLFTEGIAQWWPLDTHSVHGSEAGTCVFEAKVGGRIYEVGPLGATAEWGRIIEIDRPALVVFSWYPGRNPDTAQTVCVTFSALDSNSPDSGTLVRLEHSDFEAFGADEPAFRDQYDSGWDYVLIDRFGGTCSE